MEPEAQKLACRQVSEKSRQASATKVFLPQREKSDQLIVISLGQITKQTYSKINWAVCQSH